MAAHARRTVVHRRQPVAFRIRRLARLARRAAGKVRAMPDGRPRRRRCHRQLCRSGNILWRNASRRALCRSVPHGADLRHRRHRLVPLARPRPGHQEDRRWQKLGRDFFSWHAKYDKHFHNVRSLARVAILAAPSSDHPLRPPTPNSDKTDPIEGITLALNEAAHPVRLPP